MALAMGIAKWIALAHLSCLFSCGGGSTPPAKSQQAGASSTQVSPENGASSDQAVSRVGGRTKSIRTEDRERVAKSRGEEASAYVAEVGLWFNQRFPLGPHEVPFPCGAELLLEAKTEVVVASDGTILSASIVSPSGHLGFDHYLGWVLSRLPGKHLPAPPASQPELLPRTLGPKFTNKMLPCKEESVDAR